MPLEQQDNSDQIAGVNVEIILLRASNADCPATFEKQVDTICTTLTRLGCRHRIHVCQSLDHNYPGKSSVDWDIDRVVVNGLSAALSKVDPSSLVAIVDEHANVNEPVWQWIFESMQAADVTSCYSLSEKNCGLSSWLAQQFTVLATRVFLRTGKNQQRPGIAVFDGSVTRRLRETAIDFRSIEEVVAIVRADPSVIQEAVYSCNDLKINSVSLSDRFQWSTSLVRFWWNHIAFPKPVSNEEAVESRWSLPQCLLAFSVVLVASLILFSRLDYPLLEPDESRNAQLGLNIYETGQWMSLSLENDYYWDKPPLQAWMTAGSFHWFGPGILAARIPCALLSLATVMAVLFFGSRLFGFRTAITGAICLVLCSGFSLIARYLTMDASLCCFSTVMFLAILLAVNKTRLSKHWMIVAGTACGLGLLVKGPVIGVIVLPPVLALAWLERKNFCLQPQFWCYLLLPATLVAAPWYLAMAIVHPDFLSYFFWKHHVVRFTDAFNHQQPWWYYLPVILVMTYPAVFVLPQLARMMVVSSRTSRMAFGENFGRLVLYVSWIVGFFSISDTKLPTYILPAIPILCLLLGRTVALAYDRPFEFRELRVEINAMPARLALSVVIISAVLTVGVAVMFPQGQMTSVVILVLLFLVLAALAGLAIGCRKSNVFSWVSAVGAALIFIAIDANFLFPAVSQARSSLIAVERLAGNPDHSDAPVVYYGRPPRSTVFSLPGKQVYHFNDQHRSAAVRFLQANPHSIVVASKGDIETLQRESNCSILFDAQPDHRKLFLSSPVLPGADRLDPRVRTANSARKRNEMSSTKFE